jgi:hypothetical protein
MNLRAAFCRLDERCGETRVDPIAPWPRRASANPFASRRCAPVVGKPLGLAVSGMTCGNVPPPPAKAHGPLRVIPTKRCERIQRLPPNFVLVAGGANLLGTIGETALRGLRVRPHHFHLEVGVPSVMVGILVAISRHRRDRQREEEAIANSLATTSIGRLKWVGRYRFSTSVRKPFIDT